MITQNLSKICVIISNILISAVVVFTVNFNTLSCSCTGQNVLYEDE